MAFFDTAYTRSGEAKGHSDVRECHSCVFTHLFEALLAQVSLGFDVVLDQQQLLGGSEGGIEAKPSAATPHMLLATVGHILLRHLEIVAIYLPQFPVGYDEDRDTADGGCNVLCPNGFPLGIGAYSGSACHCDFNPFRLSRRLVLAASSNMVVNVSLH